MARVLLALEDSAGMEESDEYDDSLPSETMEERLLAEGREEIEELKEDKEDKDSLLSDEPDDLLLSDDSDVREEVTSDD